KGESLSAGLGGERLYDAARTVAASLRFRTITIDDGDIVVGSCGTWIVNRHDLIEGGFAVACKMDRGFRRNPVRAAAHVGNDDLIAEPVHLGEGCPGGHNYRGSVFLWLWSIKPMGQLASIWRKSLQIASTRVRLREVAAQTCPRTNANIGETVAFLSQFQDYWVVSKIGRAHV